MIFSDSFKQDLFLIKDTDFEAASLSLFDYQYRTNDIYQSYCRFLKKNPNSIKTYDQIPCLPIEFFKEHTIRSGQDWEPEKVFLSSGTTLRKRSRHYIRSLAFYEQVSGHIFESIYGPLEDFSIYALLPSYQQQGDSSLIHMVDYFMKNSRQDSGYVLEGDNELIQHLDGREPKTNRKLILGVSYALLDLVEKNDRLPSDCLVMETGGMKGRRKEMIREELHDLLAEGFGVQRIQSEYGMTELTSQAYSQGSGIFESPPWLRVLVRDVNDPFEILPNDKTGGLNIIDLANVDSCAFIETKDLGQSLSNGHFKVLGRFDNSDIRGCNLLLNQ